MIKNCKTCEFNFPPQGDGKGRVCANSYYGDEIKVILQEKRVCGGWQISFDEFVKVQEKSIQF